jgi:hypothetical protein
MATPTQIVELRATILARANAMRTKPLGSSQWRRAYDNLLSALRQAQTIIQAGRGGVVSWLAEGVRADYSLTLWNQFVRTAERQAQSMRGEQQLVALGATRRPSEGGQTVAQIRSAQAFDRELAARGGGSSAISEGYTFTPQDAPAASAEDIAWARRQQAQPRTRVASTTPSTAPSTVSTSPTAVPPATTATGKTAPSAADIAGASWRYGAQPAGTPQPGAPQVHQAGVVPPGALDSIRNWLNPTDKPVYLRPWFLATGATAVGLLTYVGYQSMTGPPSLPAHQEPPALPPRREDD